MCLDSMWLKISVSWPAWSWKSSIVNAIVEKYWMETADVWQVYRERAISKGLTIAEYDKLLELNPQEDIEMEQHFKHIIEDSSTDIIVSRRMWFYLLPNIVSVRFDVSPEEWAQRVFLADRGNQEKKYTTIQEALESNQKRMSRLKKRLLDVYGVDFTDTSKYTKVIDTTGKSFEQVFEEFEGFIKTLKK